MRGHEPLFAMRMRGACPSSVWICVGQDGALMWRDWPVLPTGGRWGDLKPSIEIRPQERLSALAPDFRCFIGMTAIVSGDDEARTIRVAEMCLEAACKRCFVTVHDRHTQRCVSGFFYTEEVAPWREF